LRRAEQPDREGILAKSNSREFLVEQRRTIRFLTGKFQDLVETRAFASHNSQNGQMEVKEVVQDETVDAPPEAQNETDETIAKGQSERVDAGPDVSKESNEADANDQDDSRAAAAGDQTQIDNADGSEGSGRTRRCCCR
jgi:hypothetical protein